MSFRKGAIIRHFKRELVNNDSSEYLYRYIGEFKHTETGEEFVGYQALYDNGDVHIGDMFVRPKEMFYSEVDRDKYPRNDISQETRFALATYNDITAVKHMTQCGGEIRRLALTALRDDPYGIHRRVNDDDRT